MKNLAFGMALVLPLLFVASSAMGAEGGLSETSVKYIAYFFAMAIAAFGGTQAQSAAASAAPAASAPARRAPQAWP